MSDQPGAFTQPPSKPGLSVGELAIDLAKGSPVAGVIALLGWLLLAQLERVEEDLASLREVVLQIQVDAAVSSADRWSGTEHRAYARERDLEISKIEARLSRVEGKIGIATP